VSNYACLPAIQNIISAHLRTRAADWVQRIAPARPEEQRNGLSPEAAQPVRNWAEQAPPLRLLLICDDGGQRPEDSVGSEPDLLLYSDWNGWAAGTFFYNNIFDVRGSGRSRRSQIIGATRCVIALPSRFGMGPPAHSTTVKRGLESAVLSLNSKSGSLMWMPGDTTSPRGNCLLTKRCTP
jgi:hypothetical protein